MPRLDAGHLPVLGIATTNAFHDPTPPWVISHSGSIVGLHAVVAVGIGTAYAARRFLISNSWGAEWADAGHAWLDDAAETIFPGSRLRNSGACGLARSRMLLVNTPFGPDRRLGEPAARGEVEVGCPDVFSTARWDTGG